MDDSTGMEVCGLSYGPQETFRNCADIVIQPGAVPSTQPGMPAPTRAGMLHSSTRLPDTETTEGKLKFSYLQ